MCQLLAKLQVGETMSEGLAGVHNRQDNRSVLIVVIYHTLEHYIKFKITSEYCTRAHLLIPDPEPMTVKIRQRSSTGMGHPADVMCIECQERCCR